MVKYTNSGPSITINGPVNCLTGPYRMAVFTAMDDNSVGQAISGSTGSPTGHYAFYGLQDGYTSSSVTLQYLRISYASVACLINNSGPGTNWLKHSQFVNDSTAIQAWSGTLNFQNILINNSSVDAIYGNNSTINAQNVTVDGAGKFFDNAGGSTLNLTNSLLVSITNAGNSHGGSFNFTNSSSSSVFQTVGAGTHYLAAGSPYRDAGTTNIDTNLLPGTTCNASRAWIVPTTRISPILTTFWTWSKRWTAWVSPIPSPTIPCAE